MLKTIQDELVYRFENATPIISQFFMSRLDESKNVAVQYLFKANYNAFPGMKKVIENIRRGEKDLQKIIETDITIEPIQSNFTATDDTEITDSDNTTIPLSNNKNVESITSIVNETAGLPADSTVTSSDSTATSSDSTATSSDSTVTSSDSTATSSDSTVTSSDSTVSATDSTVSATDSTVSATDSTVTYVPPATTTISDEEKAHIRAERIRILREEEIRRRNNESDSSSGSNGFFTFVFFIIACFVIYYVIKNKKKLEKTSIKTTVKL